MARSRNSFQSGYQYTLENFDRDAMKNDQIWRETQSRIEFLKMRNITMSNSADRNSLARKLVADKEWKQLDKFTKLMEMIMYLQSWFDKRLVIWKKFSDFSHDFQTSLYRTLSKVWTGIFKILFLRLLVHALWWSWYKSSLGPAGWRNWRYLQRYAAKG